MLLLNNREDTIDYMPGVESIEPKDLMLHFQDVNTPTFEHNFLYKTFEDTRRADLVVCNTVQELESKTISVLQQKQHFYAIGPVFSNGFTKSVVDTGQWSESNCSQWLNSKPNGSILYVSLGSYAGCSKEDIVEIAHGLLLSK